MDIPHSGAIFTLGKSYLAENTQSYFYIRNDPIKRLVAGPHQSAVICESGRLFVWGENNHGQLGIGNHSNHNNNNNNNEQNNQTGHGDIITKPTCVKSLKSLGLKIVDIAFGNDWSIILAHSNELFFSGRSIFPAESNISQNFTTITVADEQFKIIRKPFRIDKLDNCLIKNEDAEYYTTILAGNEHFIMMTSLGRLIAWGSNQNYQLGLPNDETVQSPHEMKLDAPVQQFVCGPESTLVLTTTGKLYLTGVLNEFVFSQFTELQQNLAPTEQIVFMHISKTNEIYIVTNAGSIYRSIESLRTKALVFQRFYDYDSEENGPIWKLLKGFSFYTVLTKANKFYTTFSESGHHLKTFREISKFKNLRLLDVAVGNQHILVHGIPRSSTISATAGSNNEPHRYASRTFVMPSNFMNGSADRSRSRGHSGTRVANKDLETGETEPTSSSDMNRNMLGSDERAITPKKESSRLDMKTNGAQSNGHTAAENTEQHIPNHKSPQSREFISQQVEESQKSVNGNMAIKDNKNAESNHVIAAIAAVVHSDLGSPTESEKSSKSVKLSTSAAISNTNYPAIDKHLRPHTPYPESSTTASTPTTIKKTTPLRNYSYEAAMDHDHIDMTSPELVDSMENISEVERKDFVAKNAMQGLSTLPFEEDEHLAVEINTTTDPMDSTIVVNEIRFINNGIDVTDNVKAESFDTEESESTVDSFEEHVENNYRKLDGTLNIVNTAHKAESSKVVSTGKISKEKAVAMEDSASKIPNTIKTEVDKMNSKPTSFVQSQKKGSNVLASKTSDELSTKTKHINEDFKKLSTDVKSQIEHADKTLTDNFDSANKVAKLIGDDVTKVTAAVKSATKDKNDKLSHEIENAAKQTTNATTEIVGSLETDIKKGLSTTAKQANVSISKLSEDLSTKAEDISRDVAKEQADWKSKAQNVTNTLTHKLENAATQAGNVAANAATEVRDSVEIVDKRVVEGARDAAETVEENTKQVTNDTKATIEGIGSSARKVATEAKNAVGNAFIKMSDGTKDAVDTVASKIANEVQGAKENISTMFHGKNIKPPPPAEDDAVSYSSEAGSKEGGPKTNTTIGEDDERTTASVNSTQNSTGNPFESPNSYDHAFDDVVERSKKAFRDDISNMQQQGAQITQQVAPETEKEKGKVLQFFSDITGISCRNEKSVAVADEPPRYTVEDKYPNSHRGNLQNNTSQVCSIL